MEPEGKPTPQRPLRLAQQFLAIESSILRNAEIYFCQGVDMNPLMGDYGFVVNEQVDAPDLKTHRVRQTNNPY